MKTVFLRLPDEASALALFSAVTGVSVASISDAPSKVYVGEMLCDVDPIGALTSSGGDPVPGWHVNIWVPDEAIIPDELTPHIVHPVTPNRVFL